MPAQTASHQSVDTVPATDGATVFISAAEPSADLHGANLIRTVHQRDPGVRFVGSAGPLMQAAGCENLFDMTRHAAMGTGSFRIIPQALAMLARSAQCLQQRPIDVAVMVDSPALNLRVARHAKRAGIPVLYYIAPQVWAWAEGRVRRIRRLTDQCAVILPFEEAYFHGHGINARFVGHPLFESLDLRVLDEALMTALRRGGKPVVAFLPGSRRHVVKEVFPGQLEVAAAIHARYPQAQFAVSIANDQTALIVKQIIARSALPISTYQERNGELLTVADLTLVASGTATLEAAYYHAPMIVMYNASWLGYYLFGKWVIRTPHLSLVNILAERELVPEFMPFYRSTAPIVSTALDLLTNDPRRTQLRADLADLVRPLHRHGASDQTAELLLNMIAARRTQPAPG